jgi:hypothetical protein
MSRVVRARILIAGLAAGAVAVSFALPPVAIARPANETNPDNQIHLKFQGNLTRVDWLGTDSKGNNFGKLTVTLSWDATAYFKDQGDFADGVDIDYSVLTGKISLDDKGDPDPQLSGLKSCSATLSERLSGYEQTITTEYDLVNKRYELSICRH